MKVVDKLMRRGWIVQLSNPVEGMAFCYRLTIPDQLKPPPDLKDIVKKDRFAGEWESFLDSRHHIQDDDGRAA